MLVHVIVIGLSIDEQITIFDVNVPYVDKYYIWTSLTRANDFNNVSIYVHSQKEIEALTKSRIKQYFENKVEGYKLQYDNAGRLYDKNDFIDKVYSFIAWLSIVLNKILVVSQNGQLRRYAMAIVIGAVIIFTIVVAI